MSTQENNAPEQEVLDEDTDQPMTLEKFYDKMGIRDCEDGDEFDNDEKEYAFFLTIPEGCKFIMPADGEQVLCFHSSLSPAKRADHIKTWMKHGIQVHLIPMCSMDGEGATEQDKQVTLVVPNPFKRSKPNSARKPAASKQPRAVTKDKKPTAAPPTSTNAPSPSVASASSQADSKATAKLAKFANPKVVTQIQLSEDEDPEQPARKKVKGSRNKSAVLVEDSDEEDDAKSAHTEQES